MQQDKDIPKIIIATGQRVKTTGQMLHANISGWLIQVKYKDGIKGWVYDNELKDISNSE